ncbi:hypothetical protein SynA1528_00412 [Synechococcus sp. A15-28]|nr:hypothetical protein SynA1528_00412 [Synechococcus sp. A15-28]
MSAGIGGVCRAFVRNPVYHQLLLQKVQEQHFQQYGSG